jgi:hypothetical protein
LAAQAEPVTNNEEQQQFVDDFCRPIRADPLYRDALFVVTVETNNNGIHSEIIMNQFKAFAPIYLIRRADVSNKNGDFLMTDEDLAKQSTMTADAGIKTGLDMMSKQHYVVQTLLTMEAGKLTRAAKLHGRNAEQAWDILLKEMTYFAAYEDVSEKKPHFTESKITFSGKKGAAKTDDMVMALMMLLTTVFMCASSESSNLARVCRHQYRALRTPASRA